MLLTLFCALLATFWMATVLTAFCPVRAWRRRRELEEGE
jgi:hypothetical protein